MELMEFITDKDEATWEASVLDFMRMRDFSCRSGSPWGVGAGGGGVFWCPTIDLSVG